MNPLKMLSDMEKQANDPKWIKAEEERSRAKSALIQKRRTTIREFINKIIKTSDPIESVPEADMFPMLVTGDAKELTESIKTSRKVEMPILIDDSGRVVDGRNRVAALRSLDLKICVAGDVEGFVFGLRPSGSDLNKAVFVTVSIVEPEKVRQTVINANIHRRHLTPIQRAAIMVKLNPKMDPIEQRKMASAKGHEARYGIKSADTSNDASAETDAELATKANVGLATVNRARQDQALDPAILDATIAGDMDKAKELREKAKAKRPARPRASKPKAKTGSDAMILQLFVQLKAEGRTRDQLIALIDKAFN